MDPLTHDELKLAYTRHVLDTIAHADHQFLPEEQALVQAVCPSGALEAAGFIDEFGAETARYAEARLQALAELPTRLDLSEKLSLVTTFLDMCIVDGELERKEGSLLFSAAQLLAITPQQFDRHLDSLTDRVGAVELGEPLLDEG